MRTVNYKTILLLGLVIVASGCISQSSEDLGEVSENLETFEGEQIVLQGEVSQLSNSIETQMVAE